MVWILGPGFVELLLAGRPPKRLSAGRFAAVVTACLPLNVRLNRNQVQMTRSTYGSNSGEQDSALKRWMSRSVRYNVRAYSQN